MKRTNPFDARAKTVVLVLRLSHGSHRDLLHGFSHGADPRQRWNFRVVDYTTWRDGTELRGILADGAWAVVATTTDNDAVYDGLRDWKGPLVTIGVPRPVNTGRNTGAAFIGLDEKAIGHAGADYIASLGKFRSYGFVEGNDGYACQLRSAAFAARIASRLPDTEARIYRATDADGRFDPVRLASWLRSLPKPCGIMTSTDACAMETFAAAAAARISVPHSMALIGCDDDALLCESTSPSLTSVAPDYVRIGEMAAATLRRVAAHPDAPSFSRIVASIRVVERQSARPIAPAAALAERAANFIRRNATKGVHVSDIVAHLGVSRSLADLRYRTVMGETMQETILTVKLDSIRSKLLETNMSIGQIVATSGFRSQNSAKRLFKNRFGISMREWRRTGGHPGSGY